ncbi:outer membrane receptor protein involved in Fe transport [Tenacibaculum adriaticum]|uniref:Outer membrane receptor protein involved in Fe transport n=1 Tax=Tenacibaculum adriaticum TaxID=413713 RepID=A0A5S5DVG4_9FLAO|nr:TonB-dependent receptor [Tenacibaculum adriaticum]TYP99980.1 outer membrane receptor protein involved in Fe transport [Tenacibaculum adriaticum]
MKNILIAVIGILLPITAFTQSIYKGKVIDKNNNPIVGVSIISLEDKNKGTATDFDGNFSIKLTNPEVKVSTVGFKKEVVILTKNFNTIKLEDNIENLDEVVVSASREVQKRQEVPASIGLLTANQIKETKAFGIEQLVNQVPGVFMSTSKASSNEQHFMATRSPISTKSLFLYVEDGLPIRPVAVFNHNALLEMNNTTFNRVEVLKGPASSIYGSEAIGGSFNFITKNPEKEFGGSLGFQINDLGLTRVEAEASTTANDKYGFYVGGHYVQRSNGPVGHSNYEKFAISFKNVNDFSEDLKWTNAVTFIDYRSDMSGSISEDNYTDGNYESNQTFTERVARALRFRSTLDKTWDEKSKTSFNFIYRNNEMDQIPSYRVKQNRNQGQLTGTGTGEINSNAFRSFVGLIQHKKDYEFANASLIFGVTADYSPQDYVAETINVTVDTNTQKNIDYVVNLGDYILNYQADIFNYAGYAQFEISPFKSLKLTGAIRYDGFSYDYDNLIEQFSGVADTKVSYTNVAPKLGFNYNLSKNAGLYGNYSEGFTPPQTSTLFRNGDNDAAGNTVFDLKPAKFDNFEVGGYFTIPLKLKVDVALYQLDGKDRLISIRNNDGDYIQLNAGETRSRGVELGLNYKVLENVSVSYSGSYAKHEYLSFFDNNVDYSNTDMQTAPKYMAMASVNYKPIKDLSLTLEHEKIGKYNTSFEGQAVVGVDTNGDNILGTSTYKGHNVFNFRANYECKQFEIWGQALNIFDELYSVRAGYNIYSKQKEYTVGNPRAFHFGIKYNF